MAQTPSIPQAVQTDVINWWLTGLSPRQIRDRLKEEHDVVTSHTSVQRLVNQVADGHGNEALVATVTRLRLRSMTLLDQLQDNLTRLRVEAGLEDASAETPPRARLDLRLFDLADRIAIRHLRLAGVGGRAGEQLMEKYAAQQRRLSDARCVALGITWPFEEPGEDTAADRAAIGGTATQETVATPPRTSAAHPALQPAPSRAPGAAESVRMAAVPSALVARTDADAPAARTPASLPLPTHIAPRRPCPCGSGLRFKHCHGKLPAPALAGPPQPSFADGASNAHAA